MKPFLLIISFLLIQISFSQEICDNALDDDGDGLIDLNDDECECDGGGLVEESLIPNPSFEDRTCCPSYYSQLYCADDWVQASDATSDYMNFCGEFNTYAPVYGTTAGPDTPLPGVSGGEGFVGIVSGLGYQEYVGACLISPMLAGEPYLLNMWIATAGGVGMADFNLCLYGDTDCGSLPWAGYICPTYAGWTLLSNEIVSFTTAGEWVNVTFEFTPVVDIETIAIGAECDFAGSPNFAHYMDGLNLFLAPVVAEVAESGGWCTNDLVLTATVDSIGGDYQWYKEGIALLGETESTLSVVDGAGDYAVRYTLDDACVVYPYTLEIPPYPTADFSFEDFCLGASSPFTDESIIDSGTIDEWLWDFGDGDTSEDMNPSQIYDLAGDYDVSLIVYSDAGCTDTINYTVSVFDLPLIDAGLDLAVCDGEDATLTGAGAGIGGVYVWDGGITDGVAFTPSLGVTEYTVIGTDANGCENMDAATVTVNPIPVIDAGLDVTVCDGDDIVLAGAGAGIGGVYVWDGGITDGVAFTPSLGDTLYTVIGTDVNGCESTDAVTVTVNPLPLIDAGLDFEVCDGDEAVLTGTGESIAYVWDGGVTNDVAFTPPPGVNVCTVTGTDVNGCENTDVITVTVNPLPAVDAGSDFAVCEGDDVVLSGTGAGIGGVYVWDGGVIDGAAFTPSLGTTVYTVIGTDVNGCENMDAISVTVNPLPMVGFFPDTTDGCVPFEVLFSSSFGGMTFDWEFGDGTTGSGMSITHTYEYTGVYDVSLTITSPEGCVASILYPSLISVAPNPEALFSYLPRDIILTKTETNFYNTSVDADGYRWDFGDGSAYSNLENPNHEYPEIGNVNYSVELIALSDNGCTDTTVQQIYVKDELLFFIPNVFTPDGDSFNEVFKPVFYSGIDIYDYHLTIFSRWGELIFESYNPASGWSGTYGNRDIVDDGVYVWKIEFGDTMSDKKNYYSGHVTILK